jgi:hypothetical protein
MLGPDDVFSGPHRQLALQVSREAIVLLKNEGTASAFFDRIQQTRMH